MLAQSQAALIGDNLATKQDLKEMELAARQDLKESELRLTIRLGSMMVVAVGVVAALVKLL